MNVMMNLDNYQILSLKTGRIAEAEDKKVPMQSSSAKDEAIISEEGREGLESHLNAMSKEDFMEMYRQWKNENPLELEVDSLGSYRKVDPDGTIATKIYFETYIGQLEENRKTIEAYYADACQEAMYSPLGNGTTAALSYIAGRYLCSWSGYFNGNMPADERKWSYIQLSSMINGTGVALNDPYALAASGGPKTVEEMDKIARQAVKEKLDALLEEGEAVKLQRSAG
ncbi:MAG: hypothetical protein HFI34_01085 [Lachnospiraceae bacterium]|nr:hypothetical protein [Lachnospiraceae bacterium]